MSQLDTLASHLPQELRTKLMQHFGIAKEYEKNRETLGITYYCLMYVAHEAIKLQKDKQFVAEVLDYLETSKRNNPYDEIIKSMTAGQLAIEELITVLVSETNEAEENEPTTSDELRVLMRKHYTIGGLVDVLSVFGPVKEDFVTLGKLSKNRAVTIFRELKAGGPTRPVESHPDQTNAIPKPVVSHLPYPSSDRKEVPFNVISEAQKLCRYTNSALEHEDISTAVKNCEQVLQLLRPYHH